MQIPTQMLRLAYAVASAAALTVACAHKPVPSTPLAAKRERSIRVGDPEDLVVQSLNVGNGLCTIIECPDRTAIMLYDCGSEGVGEGDKSAADVRTFLEKNYLTRHKAIHTVIVSHPDADHSNFLPQVVASTQVGNLVLSCPESDYEHIKGMTALIEGLRKSGTNVVVHADPTFFEPEGHEDDVITCPGSDVKFNILAVARRYDPKTKSCRGASDAPPPSPAEAEVATPANESSLVLRIGYGNFVGILMGDAEKAVERTILDRFSGTQRSFLEADYLNVGHHGSNGGTSQDWAAAVAPPSVVFSAGTRADWHHPSCTVAQRLLQYLDDDEPHHFVCGYTHDDDPKPCEHCDGSKPFCMCEALEKEQYNTQNSGVVTLETNGDAYVLQPQYEAPRGHAARSASTEASR